LVVAILAGILRRTRDRGLDWSRAIHLPQRRQSQPPDDTYAQPVQSRGVPELPYSIRNNWKD